jgi:hypothetical protein
MNSVDPTRVKLKLTDSFIQMKMNRRLNEFQPNAIRLADTGHVVSVTWQDLNRCTNGINPTIVRLKLNNRFNQMKKNRRLNEFRLRRDPIGGNGSRDLGPHQAPNLKIHQLRG